MVQPDGALDSQSVELRLLVDVWHTIQIWATVIWPQFVVAQCVVELTLHAFVP